MNRLSQGQVRIIGGRWRGSKLPVANVPGLRPTSDRARETLFNWLQPMLAGARVLDLFAGTGALGLEAASRDAAELVLVERVPVLAASLRANVERLSGGKPCAIEVVQDDVLNWLARAPDRHFDLAFVDPPFVAGLWGPAIEALRPWLAPDAWLYVEAPHAATPGIPAGFQPHRDGSTRDVRYALYRRDAATLGSDTSAEQDPARA